MTPDVEIQAALALLKVGQAAIGGLLALLIGTVVYVFHGLEKRVETLSADVKAASATATGASSTLQAHGARISNTEQEVLRLRDRQHEIVDAVNPLLAKAV